MATVFKLMNADDIVTTRKLFHEAIPLTGTIVSGTYGSPRDTTSNIRNYPHGMFQSVYDYPYLSSSANHLMDLTIGIAQTSSLSGSSVPQMAKKMNLYNQMAQILVGFDETHAIRQFDQDGDLTGGTKMNECYFVNFTRLLSKDEIKKGSFSLELAVSTSYSHPTGERIIIQDTNGASQWKVNSPAGEYGLLYASNSLGEPLTGYDHEDPPIVGHVYYQTGDVVLTSSVFSTLLSQSCSMSSGLLTPINEVLTGSSITGACDALRHRFYNCSFNNTTELNTTVYFARCNHNEFNYSANPTYLSGSKIRVKNNSWDAPISYITTVGFYSPDSELLAVAKLSEPLKKTSDIEVTVKALMVT